MSNKLLKRQNEIFLKKLTHRVEHVRIRPRKQLLRSFVLRVVRICIVWYNLPLLQLTVNDVLIVEHFKKINKPLSTTNRYIEPHKQTSFTQLSLKASAASALHQMLIELCQIFIFPKIQSHPLNEKSFIFVCCCQSYSAEWPTVAIITKNAITLKGLLRWLWVAGELVL